MEQLIKEIMCKSVDISRNTNTDIFFSYYGKIQSININIFKENGSQIMKQIYMEKYSNEELEKILKGVLSDLQEIEKGE